MSTSKSATLRELRSLGYICPEDIIKSSRKSSEDIGRVDDSGTVVIKYHGTFQNLEEAFGLYIHCETRNLPYRECITTDTVGFARSYAHNVMALAEHLDGVLKNEQGRKRK
jgi:hypothetical protein